MATVIIILFNFIFYARTLFYKVVIDDRCRYLRGGYKTTLWRVLKNWKYSGYCDINLFIDHLCTLTLHSIACVMIYICLGQNTHSFLTAILFSVLPANTQVSIWLNGKRYAANTILILAMWYLKPWGYVFWGFTPLWNVNAVMAPLLFLRTEYWWLSLTLPLFVLIGWATVVERVRDRYKSMPKGEITRIRPRKLVLFVKVFSYYFLHSLFPRRMCFYHIMLCSFGHTDEDNDYWYAYDFSFWWRTVFTLAVFGTTIYFWHTPLGFGLFWYIIFIAQYCHVPMSITQAISERASYLANVGMMYAVASVLPPSLYLPLLTYYSTLTWRYMPAFYDINEFYRYALHEFPQHFRARSHRIRMQMKTFQWFNAIRDCSIGLHYRKNDCRMNIQMAQCLMAIGMYDATENYLKKAEENFNLGQEGHYRNVIAGVREHIKKVKEKKK